MVALHLVWEDKEGRVLQQISPCFKCRTHPPGEQGQIGKGEGFRTCQARRLPVSGRPSQACPCRMRSSLLHHRSPCNPSTAGRHMPLMYTCSTQQAPRKPQGGGRWPSRPPLQPGPVPDQHCCIACGSNLRYLRVEAPRPHLQQQLHYGLGARPRDLHLPVGRLPQRRRQPLEVEQVPARTRGWGRGRGW